MSEAIRDMLAMLHSLQKKMEILEEIAHLREPDLIQWLERRNQLCS